MMTTQAIKVLLIENSKSDAAIISHALIGASLKDPRFAFEVEWVTTLAQGLARLDQGGIQVVATDLGLTDSHGLETPQQIMKQYPDLPIVVLTGMAEDQGAIDALQMGAQDYLNKNYLDELVLAHALYYAIERKRPEMRLTAMALHDPLTGLSTRIHLTDRVNHALTLAHRNQTRVAVLFLDMDKFKQVNDSLGHSVGDLLLKGIAERLTGCLRKGDTIARVGGDEFVIVISLSSDGEDVTKVAEKVIETFFKPFTLSGHTLFATTSVGIALYPENGNTLEVLMQNADAAMYFAKKKGRNNFQFYTEAMHNCLHY